MKRLTSLAFFLPLVASAQSTTVSSSNGDYEIELIQGQVTDLAVTLQDQDWYGDQALAEELAVLVGGTFGGVNLFGIDGPYFVWDIDFTNEMFTAGLCDISIPVCGYDAFGFGEYDPYVFAIAPANTSIAGSVRGDQDGDGRADILWRNVANGQNVVWLMDGGQRLANIGMQAADPTWGVVGRGDYNGDGTSDILWRRFNSGQANNGQMLLWLMHGGDVIGTSALPSVSSDNWQVVGDGDYNGDGESDILWRNVVSGRNAMWLLNDGKRTATPAVIRASVLDWEIVGDGDFDGDGKADILWRNRATGENAVWLMDGATRTANASLPAVPGTDWQIVGNADYGADGKADILWRNVATGANALWTMDGTTRIGNKGIPSAANLKWAIIGDGDYNGDGKADILWRQTVNGRNAVWLMDGDQRIASQKVPTVRIGNWVPVHVKSRPLHIWSRSGFSDSATRCTNIEFNSVGSSDFQLNADGDASFVSLGRDSGWIGSGSYSVFISIGLIGESSVPDYSGDGTLTITEVVDSQTGTQSYDGTWTTIDGVWTGEFNGVGLNGTPSACNI